MIMRPRLYRFQTKSKLLAALAILLLPAGRDATYGQEATKPNGLAMERPAGQEFALRGQRLAREIKYSDWRKFCFKSPGSSTVCRTTITGTFETGQSAVRIDLIERDGDKAARLQLFLPVGLYLQAGAKITIDDGAAWQIPYVWRLTNTRIAANVAEPKLVNQMRSGQKLVLEVVDSSVLTVTTAL